PQGSVDTQIIGSSGLVRSFRSGRIGLLSGTVTRFVFCLWDRKTKGSDRRPRWESSSVSKPVHYHPNLIFSVGTQVVTLKDVVGQNGRTLHPRGSVGVVVKAPRDLDHSYRVRFPDEYEETLKPSEITLLAK